MFVTEETTPKQGRKAALFLRHPEDPRRRVRQYRTIHVIGDHTKSHTALEVIESLWKHEGRIEVHLLPNDTPNLNPIERGWWVWHEHVTRNHQCKSLEEFQEMVFAWLEGRNPFPGEDSEYRLGKAA